MLLCTFKERLVCVYCGSIEKLIVRGEEGILPAAADMHAWVLTGPEDFMTAEEWSHKIGDILSNEKDIGMLTAVTGLLGGILESGSMVLLVVVV